MTKDPNVDQAAIQRVEAERLRRLAKEIADRLHRAVALLRMSEIEDAYAAAWDEWQEAGEHDLWATLAQQKKEQ